MTDLNLFYRVPIQSVAVVLMDLDCKVLAVSRKDDKNDFAYLMNMKVLPWATKLITKHHLPDEALVIMARDWNVSSDYTPHSVFLDSDKASIETDSLIEKEIDCYVEFKPLKG